MTLDKYFAKDIRELNGDGTWEAARVTNRKLIAASGDFNYTGDRMKKAETAGEVLKKHGRPVMAVCVALTILDTPYNFADHDVYWALEVSKLYKNRVPHKDPNGLLYTNPFHPMRIAEWFRLFIDASIAEE